MIITCRGCANPAEGVKSKTVSLGFLMYSYLLAAFIIWMVVWMPHGLVGLAFCQVQLRNPEGGLELARRPGAGRRWGCLNVVALKGLKFLPGCVWFQSQLLWRVLSFEDATRELAGACSVVTSQQIPTGGVPGAGGTKHCEQPCPQKQKQRLAC